MANPERGGWTETAKKWAIRGGIVAGVIGLVTNPNATIAAAGIILGGWFLRRD